MAEQVQDEHRVRKNKNFPDSKIFDAKNFPDKMCKLRQFSDLGQIHKSVFANLKHNYAPIMLHMVHYKRSRSSRHIFRSSRLVLDYPDKLSRLSGHF